MPLLSFAADAKLTLSLDAAKILWQKNNLDLKLADDQVRGAIGDKAAAALRPIPTLSLNTSSIETGSSTFIKQADSVARIDQVIERGNKRDLRLREAGLRLDAAQADSRDAARAGEIELAGRYYDLMLAQQQVAIAEANAALFKQSVDAAQKRVNAGDLAAADLARLSVDALRAQNDSDAARNALMQARIALANYLNIAGNQNIEASDAWPVAKPVLPLEHLEPLIQQRPDVIAANKRAEAAASVLEQARAKRTRDVTVGVQVEHNGQNRPLNTVGVGFSVPLSTEGSYSGEIARANADFDYAQRLAEQTRNQAVSEISNAHAALATAYIQLERFDGDLLNAAARARDAAELGYRHGALPLMDVLDARRTYKSTQMDAAIAHANYAKALAVWNSLSMDKAPATTDSISTSSQNSASAFTGDSSSAFINNSSSTLINNSSSMPINNSSSMSNGNLSSLEAKP